jgi:hypothetical protein
MKAILTSVALFCLCLNIHAQSEYEKKFFSENYSDTFKSESVVITRLFEEYTFTGAGGPDYKINVVYRAQYKLKDISALEAFSTLSKNKALKRYVLNQIKPDGKVNLIYEYYDKNYPDDGYEEEDEEEGEKKEKKEEIPLENLEIGDVIDYQFEYTYTTKSKNYRKILLKNGKLDNVTRQVQNYNIYKYLLYKNRLLEDQYPIASGLLIYQVPREIKLVQKPANTATAFTSRSENNKTLYECRISNMKAFKQEDFSFSYLNHPSLKYTLLQTDPEKAVFYPYQFEEGKTGREDIVALGRKIYNDKKYIPKYLYYVDSRQYPQGYTEASLDKFFGTFIKTFGKKDKDKLETLNKFHEYITNNDALNDNQFSDMAYAVLMARFCDKLGLPCQMIAGMHSYDGRFEDIISPYELTWGLHATNKKGKEVWITSYSEKSNIYQLFGSLSGSDIIAFNPKNTDPYQVLKYPSEDRERNVVTQKSEITLSDDPAYEYRIVNNYSYSGQQKTSIDADIINQFRYTDLYTNAPFTGMVNLWDIYSKETYNNQYKVLIKEISRIDSFWRLYIKGYHKAGMTKFLYSEYHFRDIEIDSFRVFENGEFKDDESAPYGFKVEFKANGLLGKTADSLLVLNLGKMITEQYQLSNYKVNERYGDVYNSNIRSLNWEVKIELPKGYTCLNLADFNKSFENEAGIFKTEVVEKDGGLVMKVTKLYKVNFLPKEKWMEMVNFLHEAASFYNKKLLLEKK